MPCPALRLLPHLALWSQPPCATLATPRLLAFTTFSFVVPATLHHPCHTQTFGFHTTCGYVVMATLCHPSGPFPLALWSLPLCATHWFFFAPPVALGSPTLCAMQYDSFMPWVLLTQSLLHHLAFVPLGLYATLLAFEPHPSSDPKPDHPSSFATCQLRFPCTLETQRLLFCLHQTNPSHACLKALGRGLEGEVLLQPKS